ncbi:MAG: hypothetical protein II131_03395 [Neisseriaceae bacterium]|nr:hypothetical protein [Neisseriaceae bacterium]
MNLWQKIGKLLLTALCCGVLFTTACGGNPEKQDIIALGKAFKSLGYENKDQEFKQKMQTVKNEDEMKAVIQEFLPIFEKTPQEIRQLNMKSEEGKKLQKDIADGFDKLVSVIRKMLTIDPNDADAVFQLNKEAMDAQMQLQQAQQRLFTLAGKHGLKMEK